MARRIPILPTLILILLALLATPWPAQAQISNRGKEGPSPALPKVPRGPVPPTPEVWPRLEDGAVLCKSRDDLVRFQKLIGPAGAAATGAAPNCHTLHKQVGIDILDHDGPSRTQVVTTDAAKETGWTNSYLPATPPASIRK